MLQEYADPYNPERAKPVAEKSGPLARFLGEGRYPIEQRIEDKKRGIGRQKYPFLGVPLIILYLLEDSHTVLQYGSSPS